MISITTFDTEIKALIAGIDDLQYKRVTTEKQAVNKLKDADGIQLVVVVPSFDTSGKLNMSVDDATTFFFVIEKYKTGATDAEDLNIYERTQAVLEILKDRLIDKATDGCSIFYRLNPQSIHIDPEYNTFGGFSGWSMALSF